MARTYAELPGLMTMMTGDEKHGPSATSTLDVLWVLYDRVLRVSPDRVDDPGRDRFLLSKGHGPAAYYAVLAAKGFIPESWLAGFGSAGSRLGYHPDRNLIPGVEIASGSLGHGLMVSVAGGLALAGLRPIVHTYAPFLVERAFEQVKLDLAHQGARAVLVSIGASYDAAPSGRTHQAPEDVALMDTVPGFAVQVPGHPDEVPDLLREAVGLLGSRSTYLRLSAESNRSALPVWPGLQVVRPGHGAVVLAVGPMLSPVLDAVGDLDVTVAYTTTVRPFDGEGLRSLASSAESDTVVLVEPYLAGTSAFFASAALAGRAFRLLSLGVGREELRRYGTPDDHAALHGLDAAGIRRSVTDFLGLL